MINSQTDYAMLMASLPPHALSLWDSKNKRLSRVQLDRHLSLLNSKDKQTLDEIQAVLLWAKMSSIEHAEKQVEQLLSELNNSFLADVVIWRLQIRTIMAAIRYRKLNQSATAAADFRGYEGVTSHIKKNWQSDDFTLSHRFPWLKEANQLFNANETVNLEKLLLNLSWQHYEKIGQGHYFDFEAVIIYVLRWDINDRWAKNDEKKAIQQFEKLVEQALTN